jgi:hypothetical protein
VLVLVQPRKENWWTAKKSKDNCRFGILVFLSLLVS